MHIHKGAEPIDIQPDQSMYRQCVNCTCVHRACIVWVYVHAERRVSVHAGCTVYESIDCVHRVEWPSQSIDLFVNILQR